MPRAALLSSEGVFMAKPTENRTKASNVGALERASSRSWHDWLALFDAAGAASLSHSDIAKIARDAMPSSLKNPEWWAQDAAIAFEQHMGLRVPGQSSAGDFRVSVSRTLGFGRDDAIERWIASFAAVTHLGHALDNARTSRTDKRSFWRASLEGAGKVEVAALAKEPGRSLVTVNHTALTSDTDIEPWRAHWKTCLSSL